MKREVKKKCKGCGGIFLKKDLNRKGYCRECAEKRLINVLRSMMMKRGYWYEKWKKGMLLWAKKLEYGKHKKKRRKTAESRSRRKKG